MWAWVKVDPSALQYIALSPNAKDMAENMYRALWSGLLCIAVTIVVSLLTKPKSDQELVGLVRGTTTIPSDAGIPLLRRPIFWAGIVCSAFIALNIVSKAEGIVVIDYRAVQQVWSQTGAAR